LARSGRERGRPIRSCHAILTPPLYVTHADHPDRAAPRDIAAFTAGLTRDDTLYTVVQNGHAFTTRDELIAMHEQWFQDPNWTWRGEVVHTVVGTDMAMALIRYHYQASAAAAPFATWLVYVFRREDGAWRIVHDQNTAVDYAAFARSAGLA
jgi:ketosteroid isomerase-like protein